ncbi:MAG: hypothetical protein NT062_08080 [Proteobacteria bacterium]|nr:hypothetical protein [Pseudomonadota bacterium]
MLAIPLVLFACGDDATPIQGDPDAPPVVVAARAVVVAGDFDAAGTMASIDPVTRTVTKNIAPQGAVDADPFLRKVDDELFVINRKDNNITILDAKTGALVEQLATGAGSNPQDVAVIGTKLYVPTFGGKGVVVLTRGSATSTEIDLGADDPDGKPNCESIFAVDGKLYVACGLLDSGFQPQGPGRVYVVDPATDTKIATVTMANKNPLGLFERHPDAFGGDLVIPTIDFADGAGCVERITVGATPATHGCATTNALLGGFANRLEFLPGTPGNAPTLLVAVNGNAFPAAYLRAVDSATGTLAALPYNPDAEHLTDVAVCPDRTIVVADQAMGTGGVRLYAGTSELTTTALDVGLPPKSGHGLLCY